LLLRVFADIRREVRAFVATLDSTAVVQAPVLLHESREDDNGAKFLRPRRFGAHQAPPFQRARRFNTKPLDCKPAPPVIEPEPVNALAMLGTANFLFDHFQRRPIATNLLQPSSTGEFADSIMVALAHICGVTEIVSVAIDEEHFHRVRVVVFFWYSH